MVAFILKDSSSEAVQTSKCWNVSNTSKSLKSISTIKLLQVNTVPITVTLEQGCNISISAIQSETSDEWGSNMQESTVHTVS